MNFSGQRLCILHMGLHKTATTTFQITCRDSCERLAEQGVNYPLFTCSQINETRICNHSIPLINLYSEKPENYHMNKRMKIADLEKAITEYRCTFADALRCDSTLLLSGEGLSTNLSANSLRNLARDIESYGYRLIPFCLVRSPYSYICSLVQQRIRGGEHFPGLSFGSMFPCDGSKLLGLLPSTAKILNRLKQVFGDKLLIYPFSKAVKYANGPVAFISDQLNLGITTPARVHANKGTCNLVIRLQNQINRIEPYFGKDLRLNPGHIELAARSISPNHHQDGEFLLTAVEIEGAKSFLDQENRLISDICGPEAQDQAYDNSDEIDADDILGLIIDLLRK